MGACPGWRTVVQQGLKARGEPPGGPPRPQHWGRLAFSGPCTHPALCTQLAPGHPEGGRAPPPVLLCVPGVPSKLWSREGPWPPRARPVSEPLTQHLVLEAAPNGPAPGAGELSRAPGPELSRGPCPRPCCPAPPPSPLHPQALPLLLAAASPPSTPGPCLAS